MNGVFIPSLGIGEVYIDVFDLRWRMLSSSFYNFRKKIPFFKFSLDMGSLMMRYYIRLDAQETDAYNLISLNDFKEKTIYLLKSYKKIESLSEDLFANNHLETYNRCMKVFDQYVQNERKNFSYYCEEINFTLINLKDELNKFSYYLDDLLTTLFFFYQKIIEEIFCFRRISRKHEQN